MNTATNSTVTLKGQPVATAQANSILSSVSHSIEHGNAVQPIIIHGPSGCGKTYLAGQMNSILTNMGYSCEHIADSGRIRLVSDFMNSIHPLLDSAQKTAIFFDEAQNLIGRNAPGVSKIVQNAMRAMIYPHGEGVQNYTEVNLSAENSLLVDFRTKILVFMTNEPETLETTASIKKGQFPFRRRMQEIELKLFKAADMPEVIGEYLNSQGLRAADCSKRTIAHFHRGSLEALASVITVFKRTYPDCAILSRDKILECAKQTQFLPRGILTQEARILRLLVANGGKMNRSLVGPNVGLENRQMNSALATLFNQTGENGHAPFVTVQNSVVFITPVGQKYLIQIEKDGFSI